MIPLFFYGGVFIGKTLGNLLSNGAEFSLIWFVIVALIILTVISYLTILLIKKNQVNGETESEKMLQPFFEASLKDKQYVLASFTLLGLLCVIIITLIVSQFILFYHSAIFWFFLFFYFVFVLAYGTYLFQWTREAYKKNITKLIPFIILFSGILGASAVALAELEFTFSYSGMALTAFSISVLILGIRFLLLANRSIFDKKAKAEEELNFASEVQQQFLNDKHIVAPFLKGFGMSVPARQVGGDFFCLLKNSDGEVIAASGDVSGHSFGAGLIMSMLNTAFEDHVFFDKPMDELFSNLNKRLMNQPRRTMFATLGAVVCDGEKASFWNAGHMPVFLWKGSESKLTEVYKKAPALGLSNRSVFKPANFTVENGDRILIYSDGVVETRDEHHKIRDIGFFKEIAESAFLEKTDSEKTARKIMENVLKHDYSPLPEDDMTMIVLDIV